jgi:hypothetical protein
MKAGSLSTLSLSLLLGLALQGCGGGEEYCSGKSCSCPADKTCAFAACDPSTSNCNFACDPGSTCSGKCGAGCQVSCSGKSCTVEAGEGSDISCSAGACNITCTGKCNVAGLGVTLTCKKGAQTSSGCGEGGGLPSDGGILPAGDLF